MSTTAAAAKRNRDDVDNIASEMDNDDPTAAPATPVSSESDSSTSDTCHEVEEKLETKIEKNLQDQDDIILKYDDACFNCVASHEVIEDTPAEDSEARSKVEVEIESKQPLQCRCGFPKLDHFGCARGMSFRIWWDMGCDTAMLFHILHNPELNFPDCIPTYSQLQRRTDMVNSIKPIDVQEHVTSEGTWSRNSVATITKLVLADPTVSEAMKIMPVESSDQSASELYEAKLYHKDPRLQCLCFPVNHLSATNQLVWVGDVILHNGRHYVVDSIKEKHGSPCVYCYECQFDMANTSSRIITSVITSIRIDEIQQVVYSPKPSNSVPIINLGVILFADDTGGSVHKWAPFNAW